MVSGMAVVTPIIMIVGLHTVCAKVTTKFLEWGKVVGNDLITPHP